MACPLPRTGSAVTSVPSPGSIPGWSGRVTNRPLCRYAITTASDTPFLPADLVGRFRAAIDEDDPKLVVARSNQGLHPTFGLWPVSLTQDLASSLQAGDRKVGDWVRRHHAEEVMFPALEAGNLKIDPFFNINRPDDLAAAEAFLQATTA